MSPLDCIIFYHHFDEYCLKHYNYSFGKSPFLYIEILRLCIWLQIMYVFRFNLVTQIKCSLNFKLRINISAFNSNMNISVLT